MSSVLICENARTKDFIQIVEDSGLKIEYTDTYIRKFL